MTGGRVLRGLWKLTWLEMKIFVREPLGLAGTVGIPVLVFVLFGRAVAPAERTAASGAGRFFTETVPVFASILIVMSAVLSLVTIIAIYREGGILKRLRATPLHPITILTAHVLVKLLLTALTLAIMILAGRRYYPIFGDVPVASFAIALIFSTLSLLSLGFVLASLVPTARFAQPIGAAIFYPMIGLSGLFVPLASLPHPWQGVARVLPLTYAVSLLQGIWRGEPWSAHVGDLAALVIIGLAGVLLSARVFRWE
jgi:ABC-2 type transport system permease protein